MTYEWLCLDGKTWHKDNLIEHGLKDGRTCRQTGERPTREARATHQRLMEEM